ncbi:MAG TPA: hypothetical protein RMH85_09310 [Polyangiaceae bacterium LLY-WYZ-15_(1-7)]|nr:hypothetical protein [Sandaracinus sp.]HJL01644.1 hypothetical protein [Polyangiaceae bacterium LLY-WYZ-15_(1-7)]MBJ71972.1 hypothetical protein [Sandaracinus sp.]HJL08684.1 hypothetical protein [Polyangiaceae bacterium LLY-WYZ-15_(1-7)]HJL22388.1 hypothetical protein [Polyangiaceae bacterium LLY-WYZ-15_(1-7)]
MTRLLFGCLAAALALLLTRTASAQAVPDPAQAALDSVVSAAESALGAEAPNAFGTVEARAEDASREDAEAARRQTGTRWLLTSGAALLPAGIEGLAWFARGRCAYGDRMHVTLGPAIGHTLAGAALLLGGIIARLRRGPPPREGLARRRGIHALYGFLIGASALAGMSALGWAEQNGCSSS